MDPGAVLLALLGSPNLASRRAVFEQYDSTVQVATAAGPGRGAAVLHVRLHLVTRRLRHRDGNCGRHRYGRLVARHTGEDDLLAATLRVRRAWHLDGPGLDQSVET